MIITLRPGSTSISDLFRLRTFQQHMKEEFEDTKGVIRIRKSKKDRQHNGQEEKDKERSTKYTHKTKDRVTRIPPKTGSELWCSGRVSSSCSTSCTRCVNLVTNPVRTMMLINYYYNHCHNGSLAIRNQNNVPLLIFLPKSNI